MHVAHRTAIINARMVIARHMSLKSSAHPQHLQYTLIEMQVICGLFLPFHQGHTACVQTEIWVEIQWQTPGMADAKMVVLWNDSLPPEWQTQTVQSWNPHFDRDEEVLEKVQRRATRCVKGMNGKKYLEDYVFWD